MHSFNPHSKIIALEEKLKKNNFLSRSIRAITEIYQDEVTFGAEIEFFLKKISIDELKSHKSLENFIFIPERGQNQYEYHINPTNNLKNFIENIENSIKKISQISFLLGGEADFSAKPFLNDFGNALQIQFSSKSAQFQNSLDKICSSFCQDSLKTFLCYAQNDDDYKRFCPEFMAPTHVSYGFNNRSCLIRINGDEFKRIEIRSPSPLCNYYVLLSAITNQIIIANNSSNNLDIKRIYGNAHDPQYKLEKLPKNLTESLKLFDEEVFLAL
jgi:glutamine synthetase